MIFLCLSVFLSQAEFSGVFLLEQTSITIVHDSSNYSCLILVSLPKSCWVDI